LLTFTACQSDRRLKVLEQAGENRTELEKVLQHYKDDAQQLKAEYLIAHIDHAFQAWASVWNNHYDFEHFCNYVLPYHIGNESVSD
jgi:hypothetical protein